MKEGIHLGARKRSPLARRALSWTAVLAAVALSVLYYREHRNVAGLEAEVDSARELAQESSTRGDESGRLAAARLRAALAAGAPSAIPPNDVLQLIAETLPEDMTLVSLTLSAPPRRSLLIEAVASGPSAVSSLQVRVTRSEMVSGTRLLEERRLAGSDLAVRFEVDLVESKTQ